MNALTVYQTAKVYAKLLLLIYNFKFYDNIYHLLKKYIKSHDKFIIFYALKPIVFF